MEQSQSEKQNRTIQKRRRVAGKAPRAVGARGGDGFPALTGWAKLCRSYGAECGSEIAALLDGWGKKGSDSKAPAGGQRYRGGGARQRQKTRAKALGLKT